MIDTYVLCCISMITALGTHNCFLFENVCLFAYYVCVCVWVHTDNGLNMADTGQLMRLGMDLKELTQVITLGNKCFTESYCQSHSNFFKISFTCVSSTFSKWQVPCSQLLYVTMTARKNKKQWGAIVSQPDVWNPLQRRFLPCYSYTVTEQLRL